MVVAVIDSGVCIENSLFVKELVFDLEVINCKVVNRVNSGGEHGTVVADLIQANCPKAQIGSIKIMGKDNECPNEYVLAAIRWCIRNHIKWVHMSFGTEDKKSGWKIKNLVKKTKGTTFVAARDNEGKTAFPADISEIWAVEKQWCYEGNPEVSIEKAKGVYHIRTCFEGPKELIEKYDRETFYSNSYQAAIATGRMLSLNKKYKKL